ncbi:MAG TPA: SDR family oxidoreductase [Chthonomonadales bacterium]|nr:SDR family oxidoreductase [Chthonomonadales bacterium]
MEGQFEERVVVVTGGSAGIGLALCRAFVAAGAEVWFCARGAERGRSAAEELGARAHFVKADVADAASVEGFARTVARSARAVDYLVNNAAVDDRIPFDAASPGEIDRMLGANLRSVILVTRAFLEPLRAGRGRAIVNVVSTNYLLGLAPFSLYNAAKSGIVGFTRSLARELGAEGIRANMVSPGWVMTEKQLREHVTQRDQGDLLEAQALKFLLTEDDIVAPVLFLLGDGARAITGQNLIVDAGKVMV